MNLCFINHNFRYELEKLVRIFMPFEKIEFFEIEVSAECYAVTVLSENTANAYLKLYDKTAEYEILLESNDSKEQENRKKSQIIIYKFSSSSHKFDGDCKFL